MRRSALFAAVVFVCTCCLGLATIEVVMRARRPGATHGAILARVLRDRYAWRRPDAEFHHVGDGIFELQFPPRGADRRRRLMIVGDSFAMGYGVDREARFGSLLEKDLAREVAIDVLATSSYSPIIYRNIVRRATAGNRYAAVALFIDQSDPADDLIYDVDLLRGDDRHRFDVDSMSERQADVDAAWDRIAGQLYGWSGLLRRSVIVNTLFPPPSLLIAFPTGSRHLEYVRRSGW